MSTLIAKLPRRLRCNSSPWRARPDRGRPRLARRPTVLLCIVLCAALGVRLGWVAATPHFVPAHDAHDFDRYGISIARFGRLPLDRHGPHPTAMAYRPPGYPVFLAGIYKTFGLTHRVVAARVIQALLGTVAVGLIAAIGTLLWASTVGIVAAVIAAVYPPLVYVTESMYAEALFVPLMLGAVAAALMCRRSPHTWRWAVATGVLCGLGVLVRANSALLVVPLMLLVWGVRRSRRARLLAPVVALVCGVLVVAPWTIRNALVLHRFVPVTTELGNTMAGTYNDEARLAPDRPAAWTDPRFTPEYSDYFWERGYTDATLDAKLSSLAFRYIRRHPGYLLEVLHWNTVRLFELAGFAESRIGGDTIGIGPRAADAGTVSFWALGLLAFGGLFTRSVRGPPRIFWLLPAAWYLSTIFLNAEAPRFRIAMDPFFILLAALAVCAVAHAVTNRLPSAGRRRAAAHAV